MSGGHCLLAVANDIDDFDMLGTSLDEAPGDCIDKVKLLHLLCVCIQKFCSIFKDVVFNCLTKTLG